MFVSIRPVFGRLGTGDGKNFDARQKIGQNDARQRLGGGVGGGGTGTGKGLSKGLCLQV